MAKKSKLGVASAIVVGAGAAALYAKRRVKTSRQKQTGRKKADETQERNEYRNTERGKYEKTAKVFITATATTKHLPVRKTGRC